MFKHLFLCRQFRLNGLHQIKIANNTIGNMIVRKPNSNSNSPQGEMVNHMIGNIPNLHAFASTSELKTLVYNPNEETTIIKDKYQLESDVIYSFENLKLIIIKDALLTVGKYNSETNQNDGILRKGTHLTFENDTKITVNGEDISVVKNMRNQGESYQGIPKESRLNNCGRADDAGGGGYGANDMNGINSKNGGININRGGIASLDMLIVALQGTNNPFSFHEKRQINWRTQARADNKERIKIIFKALTKQRTIKYNYYTKNIGINIFEYWFI